MYPRQIHQDFRRQRMSLSDFSELADIYVNAIFIAFKNLKNEIILYEVDSTLCISNKILMKKYERLEISLKDFHDSIEFSANLPLVVVPFLLPLLALLKRALFLTNRIKRSLVESGMHVENYKVVQEEIKDICDDIGLQVIFLNQRSMFRENSLKNAKKHFNVN